MNVFALLFSAAVIADPVARSVEMDVVTLDPGVDQELEFLVVGPGSDHAYEALFTSVAEIGEIAEAFDKAKFPKGGPVGYCSYYPTGYRVKVEPDISTLIKDSRSQSQVFPDVIYTGGSRHPDGSAVAATNMPLSLFALYNLPQSLLQFNEALEQSPTYGRFKAKGKTKKGVRRKLKFTLVPDSCDYRFKAEFKSPSQAVELLKKIKHLSETKSAVDVLASFSGDLKLGEAIAIAKALRSIESPKVKINGCVEGEFYYPAFLPLEAWRDRKLRLSQPVEIHIGESPADDTLCIITADWSDEKSDEPKLIEKKYKLSPVYVTKEDTCLVFAKSDTKLSRIYEIKRQMPKTIKNWYVYP